MAPGVPLRGDADAIAVNWLMIEIRDACGELTYRNSFVTDLAVSVTTSPNSPLVAG